MRRRRDKVQKYQHDYHGMKREGERESKHNRPKCKNVGKEKRMIGENRDRGNILERGRV